MAMLTAATSLGAVQGIRDQGVCSWRGIPYAQPLKPERRFLPPEPVKPWRGVMEADYFGSIAPQRSFLRRGIGEDCLNLNIWSPDADSRHRPVLCFIHGGSFEHGSGSESFYNGATLAGTWDVLVVTINYRLGVLGFLDYSMLSSSFTPNLGLQDVLSALAWVHEHIENFGGDPDRITVFGQSAGGTMVSALSVMEEARRYISRCMMISGGPTQVQSLDECREITEQYLDFMDIQKADDLISTPLDDLAKSQREFISYCGLGAATYRLAVDGVIVKDYPIPAAREGATAGIPLLIGTTQEEMALINFKPLAKVLDVDTIVNEGISRESRETRRALIDAYTSVYGRKQGESMLYTDLLFRISSVWFSEAASNHSPTWMYRFDFESAILKMNGIHAFHSTDLPFIFGNLKHLLVRPMFLLDRDMSEVHQIAEEIQKDIITFARDGKLPWHPCRGEDTPAKCYDSESSVQPMVDPRIKHVYDLTEYKRKSLLSIRE